MIKWGIIGLGNIAARFAKSLENESGGKLVAVASLSGKNVQYYTERYNVNVYSTYEELLKSKDVDAVYIALPHELHLKYTIRALNLKKAVLCEKPGAMTYEEMYRVTKCAKRNKTFYMEAVKTPFIPMIEVIKEVLSNKIIGDVKEIYACFSSKAEGKENTYLFDKNQGGAILDVATYPISFAMQIADNFKVLSIHNENKEEKINEINVNTHFNSIIELEGGMQVRIEGGIDMDKERTAIIKGTLGCMYVPIFNRPESYRIEFYDGKSYEEKLSVLHDDMYGEIHEVHKCIADGKIESSRQSFHMSEEAMKIIDDMRDIKKYSSL